MAASETGDTVEDTGQRQQADLDMMEQPDEQEIHNNPYILSKVQPMGKHSFVDSRQSYYRLAPPPKYLDKDTMDKYIKDVNPVMTEAIMSGFQYSDDGGLVNTD